MPVWCPASVPPSVQRILARRLGISVCIVRRTSDQRYVLYTFLFFFRLFYFNRFNSSVLAIRAIRVADCTCTRASVVDARAIESFYLANGGPYWRFLPDLQQRITDGAKHETSVNANKYK